MSIRIDIVPPLAGRIVVAGALWQPGPPEACWQSPAEYPPGTTLHLRCEAAPGFEFTHWAGDVTAEQAECVPLTLENPPGARQVTAHFRPVTTEKPTLSLDADFDNGNAITRTILQRERMVGIEARQVNGAYNIWWHFHIHGIDPGEFLGIYVAHTPTAGDCHPVYSYDGEHWQRFSTARGPLYTQRFTANSVEVARNIPYPYGRSLALAATLSHPRVTVSDLAVSEGGRSVKMFRVTDSALSVNAKPVFWLHARQHAFESHSSWVAEGMLRWLISNDAAAEELCRRVEIYVVPIMDVDNVFNGGAGKDQFRDGLFADFNRDWADGSRWQAVRAVKQLLLQIHERQQISAFIDLHNPWYDNPPHIHLYQELAAMPKRFDTLFEEAVRAQHCANSWRNVWPKVDQLPAGQSLPAAGSMWTSCQWAVHTIIPPAGVSAVIEIPHWQDDRGRFITQEGLLDYGKALGYSLLAYLQSG